MRYAQGNLFRIGVVISGLFRKTHLCIHAGSTDGSVLDFYWRLFAISKKKKKNKGTAKKETVPTLLLLLLQAVRDLVHQKQSASAMEAGIQQAKRVFGILEFEFF
jgi:hypothetical protein